MKKILLTLSCAVAISASAQVQKIEIDNQTASPVKVAMKTAVASGEVSSVRQATAPQKSKADEVYYKVPTGTMWWMADRPAFSWGTPRMTLAPWTDLVFENKSAKKDGDWQIITEKGEIDLTKYTDENNDLTYMYSGGNGGYYGISYTEDDIRYIPTTSEGEEAVFWIDGIRIHSFIPSIDLQSAWYGRGVLSTQNLYGAGTYDNKGTTLISLGTIYSTPKPLAPLHVENIILWGLTQDATLDPLGGNELTIKIFNSESDSKEPVEVLTCTPDEVLFDRESNGAADYQVYFTKKVLDETSGEVVAAPFVIDYPADIYILGFDQEGVNLGLTGCDLPDEFVDEENDNLNSSPIILLDPTDNSIKYLSYNGNTMPWIGFTSMYEHVEVVDKANSTSGTEYADVNFMFVSADGQGCMNNVFSNIPGVEVLTAIDWFETDDNNVQTGNEMYWSDDMYDYEWIMGMAAMEIEDEDGYVAGGEYYLVFDCEALPEGETERYAQIHINGRGVTSNPLFIIQKNIDENTTREELDASVEACKKEFGYVTGISSTKATANDGKTYNLMGQQVNGNAKGLVIRDGKKFIVK